MALESSLAHRIDIASILYFFIFQRLKNCLQKTIYFTVLYTFDGGYVTIGSDILRTNRCLGGSESERIGVE